MMLLQVDLKFFNHITGDFEVRKLGRVDVITKSAQDVSVPIIRFKVVVTPTPIVSSLLK